MPMHKVAEMGPATHYTPPCSSLYYVMIHLMHCQTQHGDRMRLLIEETKLLKKSHMKLGKEQHAACELWVSHSWDRAFTY